MNKKTAPKAATAKPAASIQESSPFEIWQSVIVTNKEHVRIEQAGVIFDSNMQNGEVIVKFDGDEDDQEAINVNDLKGL